MRYTTADELNYIEDLYRRDPEAARQYCDLLLRTDRRWDPGVCVEAVHLKARQILERCRAAGSGAT